MARAKKEPTFNLKDGARKIAESLRNQAIAPNLYGYEPHEKQVIFHTCDKKEFILDKNDIQKVRFYVGGNRSGKTVGGIVEDIWWVTKKHPYIDIASIWPEPIRGRICTTDFTNGGEGIIIPALKRWTPASEFRGGSWETAWDAEDRTVHFANEGFIELRSYDQQLDKHAGTSRHFVHFDEEPPEDIYGENMARLIDTGGRCWFTMTPVEGMTWTYDKLYEPGAKGEAAFPILIINVSMRDNPHISEEEIAVFESLFDTDEDEGSMRVDGKYLPKTGLIYPDFKKEIHVIENWIPDPRQGIVISSMDHGYTNPTSWHWHCLLPNGRLITFWEYYERLRTVRENAQAVLDIERELGRSPDFRVGDPSIRNTDPITKTSVLEEYGKRGIFIQANPGLNDVEAGLDRVRAYMKPLFKNDDGKRSALWACTKRNTHLIHEIEHYRYEEWKDKRAKREKNPKEKPRKKDDHACDDLRYLLMSRPNFQTMAMELIKGIKPLDYSPVEASRAVNPMNAPAIIESPRDIKSDGWEYDFGKPNTNWEVTQGW